MKFPFYHRTSFFRKLQTFNNKIKTLRYNPLTNSIQTIKNSHRISFPRTSLSINKISSIIAIQNILNQRFTSLFPYMILVSIRSKNLIEIKRFGREIGNLQINQLVSISENTWPLFWLLLVWGSWPVIRCFARVENNIVDFILEWGSDANVYFYSLRVYTFLSCLTVSSRSLTLMS